MSNKQVVNKSVKKKKSKTTKTLTKIIAIVVIAAALVIFVNVGKQVYNMITLQRQAAVVEEQLKALEEENATLISTRDKLNDPNYVETYARGEYMFSKGDEKVFYLPGSEEE